MHAVLRLSYHEMWKDEWQAWLLSRDLGWWELSKFLYYEGHPVLWYYYLKIFTYLPASGEMLLKWAHLIPFALTVWLWWKQPIPLWLKCLGLLSYPFFFEYGMVSRGYILVMLLSLVFIQLKERTDAWPAVVLFLLCQTEIQGVLLAVAFFGSSLLARSNRPWPLSKNQWRSGIGLLLGMIVFVITVFPRGQKADLSNAYSADFSQLTSWLHAFQGTTSNVFAMGWISDTNVYGLSSIAFLLGLGCLFVLHRIFHGQRRAYLMLGVMWLTMFLFHSIVYPGGLRHWSMIFWAFLLGLTMVDEADFFKEKIRLGLIILLFLGPLYYNFLAVTKEINGPFTNAKITATFLEEHVPENVPVVAINKFECTPVVGYSDRPIYALPDGEAFSYFKWVEKVYLPTEEELTLFAKYKNAGGLVILSPGLLSSDRFPNLQEWKRFDQANIKGENYVLYTLKRSPN